MGLVITRENSNPRRPSAVVTPPPTIRVSPNTPLADASMLAIGGAHENGTQDFSAHVSDGLEGTEIVLPGVIDIAGKPLAAHDRSIGRAVGIEHQVGHTGSVRALDTGRRSRHSLRRRVEHVYRRVLPGHAGHGVDDLGVVERRDGPALEGIDRPFRAPVQDGAGNAPLQDRGRDREVGFLLHAAVGERAGMQVHVDRARYGSDGAGNAQHDQRDNGAGHADIFGKPVEIVHLCGIPQLEATLVYKCRFVKNGSRHRGIPRGLRFP